MKPKNNEVILKAYYKFAAYLIVSVLLTTVSFWAFLQTSSKEIACIQKQQAAYDKVYTRTIDLIRYMGSTYDYLNMMNRNEYDNVQLVITVSKRKINMQHMMESMDKEDCAVYAKLCNDLNVIMSIKDSIRLMTQKEELVRQDLLKCLDENRRTLRKASLKGIK